MAPPKGSKKYPNIVFLLFLFYNYVNKKDLPDTRRSYFLHLERGMMNPSDNHFRRQPRRLSRCPLSVLALFALGVSPVLLFLLLRWPAGDILRVQAHSDTPAHHVSVQRASGEPAATRQRPGTVPAPTPIETLSASLAASLRASGSNVGVAVYDRTRQRSYSSNGTEQFLTASSIKVPIMLAFLAMTESQGRQPDEQEQDLLTAMIEHSDNDAASALFDEIGGAAGIKSYFQRIGISGLTPHDGAWGYSQITPRAMVELLTQVHDGTILTAADRATALNLMQQIETDQQWGVGDTAPAGATVAMKNGWVPGPDGLWSVNTSGIVTAGGETYIVSVYTQEQQSLADGQAMVRQICSAVAAALISQPGN